MRRLLALAVFASSCLLLAQNPPASNPQALTFAAQSIAALTGGNPISDLTITGSVTWIAGSDEETGSATLLALGTGESRVDLGLTNGTRTEIRDAQTGTPLGKWIAPSGASGKFATHNCLTDAVWFFPALGSLAAGPNVVLSYVGQETRNGKKVQHLESYVYQPNQIQRASLTQQQLSTMDFYLDATTLLPSAVTFNVHPDNNAAGNIPVEIDFSSYQAVNGVFVPMHIQKYVQGTLMIDLTVTSAVFNSGVALSNFTVN
jgi:hypothetical protein